MTTLSITIYKGNEGYTETEPYKPGDKVYARVLDGYEYQYLLCTVKSVKFDPGDPNKTWVKPYWVIELETDEDRGYLSTRNPSHLVPESAKCLVTDLLAHRSFHAQKSHDWQMIEVGYKRALEALGLKKS